MDLPTLLSATSLTHLTESLKDCSLDELKSLPRAALLNKLKEVGVSKLTERRHLNPEHRLCQCRRPCEGKHDDGAPLVRARR